MKMIRAHVTNFKSTGRYLLSLPLNAKPNLVNKSRPWLTNLSIPKRLTSTYPGTIA